MHKQTYIVHIGLPKCASTSLQFYMWNNRKWFHQQGFSYPDSLESDKIPKHQHLVGSFMRGEFDPSRITTGDPSIHTTILSTEGLTNHLYDFKPQGVAAFRDFLAPHATIGLLLKREKAAWLRSYYIQCALNPVVSSAPHYATALELDAFCQLEQVSRLADFEQVAQDAASAFGFDRVESVDCDQDMLANISRTTGLPVAPNVDLPRQNTSPPARIVEIIRQINTHASGQRQREAWLGIVQAWSQTGNTIMKSYADKLTEDAWGHTTPLLDALQANPQGAFALSAEDIAELTGWVEHQLAEVRHD